MDSKEINITTSLQTADVNKIVSYFDFLLEQVRSHGEDIYNDGDDEIWMDVYDTLFSIDVLGNSDEDEVVTLDTVLMNRFPDFAVYHQQEATFKDDVLLFINGFKDYVKHGLHKERIEFPSFDQWVNKSEINW